MSKGPVTYTNIHVSKGVDDIKHDEVKSNNGPVLVSCKEEREEKGWSKGGNANEVLLKVLYERGRWESCLCVSLLS